MSSTDTEAALWRALFAKALAECERQFDTLARSNPMATAPGSAAAVQMSATIAVPNLKVAGLLLEQGWYPESRSPVRTSWEATVDLAYLMHGVKRNDKGRLYLAMGLLRTPNLLGDWSEKNIAELRRRLAKYGYEQAEREFGSHKGKNADGHWTGENKGIIRVAADDYVASKLGADRGKNLIKATKRGLFNVGSTYVHADPAVWVDVGPIPMAERIHPRHDRVSAAHSLAACTAAVIACIPIADRNRDLDAALSLVDEFDKLIRDCYGDLGG